MNRIHVAILLALGLAAGASGGYWYARLFTASLTVASSATTTPAADRKIIYFRDRAVRHFGRQHQEFEAKP
jgi:hypothetical protein